MKSDWLFCCLVRAPNFFPQLPWCTGVFELTKAAEVRPTWEQAFLESAQQRNLVPDEHCYRARCFFTDDLYDDVVEYGVLYARELVGLLPLLNPMVDFEFLRVGFIADLKSGAASSLPPTARERQRKRLAGSMFAVDGAAVEPNLTLNTMLVSSPADAGKLAAALRRSTHWQHVAAAAEDLGEELLAQWMACETLSRVTVNEVLTAKFVSALSFPSGKYLKQFELSVREELSADPNIEAWERRLKELFDRLRGIRNDIAHEGHRGLEVLGLFGKGERHIVTSTMRMLLPRLQQLALAGLRLHLRSIDELWSNFARAYAIAHNGQRPAHDATGNVIFTLERPDLFSA